MPLKLILVMTIAKISHAGRPWCQMAALSWLWQGGREAKNLDGECRDIEGYKGGGCGYGEKEGFGSLLPAGE